MDKYCKYSVLRYVPDENRKEFINVGLVFHSPEDHFIDLQITNNFSRVTAFDDEIDISFLKIVLEGIKDEFTISTINGPNQKQLGDKLLLEKSTSIYANQLQFSPIHIIRSSDISVDFEILFRMYVYFDVPKKKRITEIEVRSMLNRVLRANEVFQKLDRNFSIDIGTEQIELDYAYKTKQKLKIIKAFSFDYASRKSIQATEVAKVWAYNFNKLKHKSNYLEKYNVNINDIDLTTLVYVGNHENKNIRTAINILKEETNTEVAKETEGITKFANQISHEIEQTTLHFQ
jgi:hypothetical protein